jgi:hypothetical protein
MPKVKGGKGSSRLDRGIRFNISYIQNTKESSRAENPTNLPWKKSSGGEKK